jgi:hypothetical protein
MDAVLLVTSKTDFATAGYYLTKLLWNPVSFKNFCNLHMEVGAGHSCTARAFADSTLIPSISTT